MRRSSRIAKNYRINRPSPFADIEAADGDQRARAQNGADKAILDKAPGTYIQIHDKYGHLLAPPTPTLFSVLFATWGRPDWELIGVLFGRWPELTARLARPLDWNAPHIDRGLRRVVLDTADIELLEGLWRSGHMTFREDDVNYVISRRDRGEGALGIQGPSERWGAVPVLALIDGCMRAE